MECSLRLWVVYYGIGLTLVFIIFFGDEFNYSSDKDPLTFKHNSVFENYQNLKQNCKIYNYFSKHNLSKPPKSTYLKKISNLSRKLPSKLLKIDLARKILFCLSSKTGATNWSRLSSAIKRNITFDDLLQNYDHDMVYEDQPTLYEIKEGYWVFQKYQEKGKASQENSKEAVCNGWLNVW